MHPAGSVIIFTTLSGMGFGLMAWLGLARPGAGFVMAAIVAVALAVTGLAASSFHLGNPQRAWRAFSQWRTSWLSREGILSILTLGLFSVYAASAFLWGTPSRLLGLPAAVAAIATVYATAMIYAQLKTVPRWHTQLTPLCYLLFAAAGGGLWAAFLNAIAQEEADGASYAALAALAAAWVAKLFWWRRVDATGLAAAGSSPETATGLGPLGRVSLLEAPHSSPNYLMKEMVYRIGRKHVRKLRAIALVAGGIVPAAILLAFGLGSAGIKLLVLALVFHIAGMLCERWLFFAEAEHVVSLYYGQR